MRRHNSPNSSFRRKIVNNPSTDAISNSQNGSAFVPISSLPRTTETDKNKIVSNSNRNYVSPTADILQNHNQIKGQDTLLATKIGQANSGGKAATVIEYLESADDNTQAEADDEKKQRDAQDNYSIIDYEEAEIADSISLIMENVVNSYMDPLVVINAKGIIKNVNQAFLRMTGYERWEIASKNVKRVVPDNYAVRHDVFLDRYIKSRIRKIIGESRSLAMKRKDGSLVPVLLRINELKDKDGIAFFAVIRSLEQEHQLKASKDVIMSMLPKEISLRMEAGETNIADEVEATSVFVDIFDFNRFVSSAEPLEIVQLLSKIFTFYDEICQKYELERIKTIGSTYMAVCGVSQQHRYDHAQRVIDFAIDLILLKGGSTNKFPFQLKIGIAAGKMVAGVIQGGRVSYDIWGDTVNISSRCQAMASPDGITVNETAYLLTRSKVPYSPVAMREVKGKGILATYDVDMSQIVS